ncbi:hypothetical protein BpHYR1_001476 [Brachionus plicatilis]|uniref:Uncharacterized protein n=1 Tax=Brachionus plicatilis TaxID=10195 RepID=A0A3M7PTQ4_BRAPC|nr:hypothetical protein BpHYR1_001476 [Brachionus plicatilis]
MNIKDKKKWRHVPVSHSIRRLIRRRGGAILIYQLHYPTLIVTKLKSKFIIQLISIMEDIQGYLYINRICSSYKILISAIKHEIQDPRQC